MAKVRKKEAIENFRDMLRLKTVSYSVAEKGKTDDAAFRHFQELLAERFPYTADIGEWRKIGPYGILIRIPGKTEGHSSVLMAHMDVVPADPASWHSDPFGAEMRDGRIWGRGSLDTKGSLCSIMEAVEYHLACGFVPKHDIWLSFGGEEEVSGPCCPAIVDELERLGVYPDLVLDEGGSMIPEGVPGLRKQMAMIGIAEKGVAVYELTITGNGGHASVPPKTTVIGRLSKAAEAIESSRMPARISGPIRQMFSALAGEVPFYERPVFAHPELAAPAISAAASYLGGTFNAMVRTTFALTMVHGGSAPNVLPGKAALTVNARLLEGDTVESVRQHLERLVRKYGVEVKVISGSDPSPVSEVGGEAWQLLTGVIRKTWPGAVIAPYQMNGGTDGRFMSRISDHVYRFLPMIMTKEERAAVHGADESIAVEKFFTMIRFYIRLVSQL